MGSIEVVVDPSGQGADVRLDACGSLDELDDELRVRFGGAEGQRVVVALYAGPGAPVTIPEAVRVLVEAHTACGGGVSVICLVVSEGARRAAERHIPSFVRADRWASYGALEVAVVQGDLVAVAVGAPVDAPVDGPIDAIVNASNVRLELGAGVSGVIKSAVARPAALQAEMYARAPIEPGEVVATSAHGLGPVRVILHAATASGGEASARRAYRDILALAERMQLRSVAVPALGTGTGRLAPERSAALLREALETATPRALRRLVCVLHDGETADVFAAALGAQERLP